MKIRDIRELEAFLSNKTTPKEIATIILTLGEIREYSTCSLNNLLGSVKKFLPEGSELIFRAEGFPICSSADVKRVGQLEYQIVEMLTSLIAYNQFPANMHVSLSTYSMLGKEGAEKLVIGLERTFATPGLYFDFTQCKLGDEGMEVMANLVKSGSAFKQMRFKFEGVLQGSEERSEMIDRQSKIMAKSTRLEHLSREDSEYDAVAGDLRQLIAAHNECVSQEGILAMYKAVKDWKCPAKIDSEDGILYFPGAAKVNPGFHDRVHSESAPDSSSVREKGTANTLVQPKSDVKQTTVLPSNVPREDHDLWKANFEKIKLMVTAFESQDRRKFINPAYRNVVCTLLLGFVMEKKINLDTLFKLRLENFSMHFFDTLSAVDETPKLFNDDSTEDKEDYKLKEECEESFFRPLIQWHAALLKDKREDIATTNRIATASQGKKPEGNAQSATVKTRAVVSTPLENVDTKQAANDSALKSSNFILIRKMVKSIEKHATRKYVGLVYRNVICNRLLDFLVLNKIDLSVSQGDQKKFESLLYKMLTAVTVIPTLFSVKSKAGKDFHTLKSEHKNVFYQPVVDWLNALDKPEERVVNANAKAKKNIRPKSPAVNRHTKATITQENVSENTKMETNDTAGSSFALELIDPPREESTGLRYRSAWRSSSRANRKDVRTPAELVEVLHGYPLKDPLCICFDLRDIQEVGVKGFEKLLAEGTKSGYLIEGTLIIIVQARLGNDRVTAAAENSIVNMFARLIKSGLLPNDTRIELHTTFGIGAAGAKILSKAFKSDKLPEGLGFNFGSCGLKDEGMHEIAKLITSGARLDRLELKFRSVYKPKSRLEMHLQSLKNSKYTGLVSVHRMAEHYKERELERKSNSVTEAGMMAIYKALQNTKCPDGTVFKDNVLSFPKAPPVQPGFWSAVRVFFGLSPTNAVEMPIVVNPGVPIYVGGKAPDFAQRPPPVNPYAIESDQQLYALASAPPIDEFGSQGMQAQPQYVPVFHHGDVSMQPSYLSNQPPPTIGFVSSA